VPQRPRTGGRRERMLVRQGGEVRRAAGSAESRGIALGTTRPRPGPAGSASSSPPAGLQSRRGTLPFPSAQERGASGPDSARRTAVPAPRSMGSPPPPGERPRIPTATGDRRSPALPPAAHRDAYHASSNTVLYVSISCNSRICKSNILAIDGVAVETPCYL